MGSSNDSHRAPKGMFRVVMSPPMNKGLDYNSLEQAKKLFDVLIKMPDTKERTIIIYNDAGKIELSNSA